MDFEEYVQANYKRLEGQTRELVEDAYLAGQQSKQAEIDALKARVLAMESCMDEAIRLIDEGNSWDAKELLK